MFKALLIALSCFVIQVSAKPIDTLTPTLFTYYTESYAPANYYEGNKLKGASVETLKLIWDNMGVPEQPIKLVPWARGYRSTASQPLTVLFSMIRTPERELAFKWVGPIFVNSLALIALNDFDQPINSFEDVAKYGVVTVRHDVSEISLLSKGYPSEKMISVTDQDQALKVLESKRADFMVVTYESMPALLAKNNSSLSAFKKIWTLGVNGNYYAFNRATPDTVITKFQTALDNVREQHLKVLERYNLPFSIDKSPLFKNF